MARIRVSFRLVVGIGNVVKVVLLLGLGVLRSTGSGLRLGCRGAASDWLGRFFGRLAAAE